MFVPRDEPLEDLRHSCRAIGTAVYERITRMVKEYDPPVFELVASGDAATVRIVIGLAIYKGDRKRRYPIKLEVIRDQSVRENITRLTKVAAEQLIRDRI